MKGGSAMLLNGNRTFVEFLQEFTIFSEVKSSHFSAFVVPFYLSCIVLFSILLYKYISWFNQIDKKQHQLILHNLFSRKFFSAIKETIYESLIHHRIYKRNPLLGYMHMSLALGWFLMIVFGKAESVIYNRSLMDDPSMAVFFRYFVRDTHVFWGQESLSFIMDFLLLLVLSGVILAMLKRFYSNLFGMKKTTKQTILDKFALTSLWFIFPLRLFAESVTAGITHNGSFLTQSFGDFLTAVHMPLASIELLCWWIYSLDLCVFFVCMPFSRYMHIFTEVLLIFLRKLGTKTSDQFDGYSRVQLNACSRCGICIDACQMGFAAGIDHIQSINFVADTRYIRLSAEVLNNCLMCDRCVDACPVGIESTLIRQQIRNKTSEAGKLYYAYDKSEKSTEEYSVIYFAGCMTHLTPTIIQSMKKIFEHAGERYWFMDESKGLCCGRPLRLQGFQQQADELVLKNKELIVSSGAKILVTSCPICYKTFKENYQIKDIKILHHTEYIDLLIRNGRLKTEQSDLKIVYHDPCELGRGSKIYDEPRRILRTVGKLEKIKKDKNQAYCCGNTLGNTLLSSEKQNAIRDDALNMLTRPNPDVLVTACPLCKKTFANANTIKVKDMAEIVADSLVKSSKFRANFSGQVCEDKVDAF